MPSAKGYHSYHGRGGPGRVILIVLLCLILFAAIGFLVLQRYAVYETDGSVRFDLPWKRAEAPSGTGGAGSGTEESPDVVIDTPGASETPDSPDAPKPPTPSEPDTLRAAELDAALLNGSADAALAAIPENANAVAIRLKNERGELLYASKLSSALDAGAVKGGSSSEAVLKALTESGRYTIARINATHDSLYSFAHMADAAILQLNYPGYIWYAPDSSFYLAPEKAAARAYIVSVAQECAALGFDELLFDEFGYPTAGRLSNIDESARPLSKSAALAQLARELRSGTESYGVKLSVTLSAETVLAGGNETAGQDLAALAEAFDRIYVEAMPEQLPALSEAMQPYAAELVPILQEPAAEGSYLLAA